ncbi:MAG: hypothetical protein K2J20_01895, partial [Bacilli bacterium]|nr:hypothetical protein [Bacilli bacterium]
YRSNYECNNEFYIEDSDELFGFDIDDSDERERHVFKVIANDIFRSLFFEIIIYFDAFASPLFSNAKDFLSAKRYFADCLFSEYDGIKDNEDLVNLSALQRLQRSFNEISGKIQNFEDAKFLLDYMFQCVIFASDSDIFSQVDLFRNTDENSWDFAPIYVFNFNNQPLYFTLKKENNQWQFTNVSPEEVEFLARAYKGQNKDLLYRR